MGSPVFELYNADGTLQLNLASRLTKYLGSVTITSTVAGSISDPRLLQGTPWFVYTGPNEQAQARATVPDVVFSGSTMSWSAGIGTATTMIIAYGIYSNGSN